MKIKEKEALVESDGGIVELSLPMNKQLEMNEVELINSDLTETEKANSIIYITVEGTPSAFKMASVTFSSTSAHTNTKERRNIHISCEDATTFIDPLSSTETPKTSDFTGTIEAHDEEIVNLYWVKETIPADKTPPRTVFSSLSPLPLRSPSHTSHSVPHLRSIQSRSLVQ